MLKYFWRVFFTFVHFVTLASLLVLVASYVWGHVFSILAFGQILSEKQVPTNRAVILFLDIDNGASSAQACFVSTRTNDARVFPFNNNYKKSLTSSHGLAAQAFTFDVGGPSRQRWTQVQVCGSWWIPTLLLGAFSTWRLARWLRRKSSEHHCRCGYDLTGNQSGICPECGCEARWSEDGMNEARSHVPAEQLSIRGIARAIIYGLAGLSVLFLLTSYVCGHFAYSIHAYRPAQILRPVSTEDFAFEMVLEQGAAVIAIGNHFRNRVLLGSSTPPSHRFHYKYTSGTGNGLLTVTGSCWLPVLLLLLISFWDFIRWQRKLSKQRLESDKESFVDSPEKSVANT